MPGLTRGWISNLERNVNYVEGMVRDWEHILEEGERKCGFAGIRWEYEVNLFEIV